MHARIRSIAVTRHCSEVTLSPRLFRASFAAVVATLRDLELLSWNEECVASGLPSECSRDWNRLSCICIAPTMDSSLISPSCLRCKVCISSGCSVDEVRSHAAQSKWKRFRNAWRP